MVNPSAMESRYRDRPESNSRQNFARLTGTRVTRVNSRVPEKNAQNVQDMTNVIQKFYCVIINSISVLND